MIARHVIAGVACSPFAALAAVYGCLLLLDGTWAARDRPVEEACAAALRAEGVPPGHLDFPTLKRVCSDHGLVPEYRNVRDECFTLFAGEGSRCEREMREVATTLPVGGEVCVLDLPCGRHAYDACSAAFPYTLWR